MFLLLLLAVLVTAGDIVLLGLDHQFQIVPSTAHECNSNDQSCYKITCNMLGNNDTHVSYVAYSPLQRDFSCSFPDSHIKTNMMTFGIDQQSQILYKYKCNTLQKCLNLGCKKYDRTKTTWFILTGKCI
jgi:hypothetical protein